MLYLDGIRNELQTGQGQYDLDKLDDIPYLEKLSVLNDYCDDLLTEILIYWVDQNNQKKVIQMNETYFNMANDVVRTAEFYLEQKTKMLASLELVMAILLGLLIVISLQQAITEIHLFRKNKELATPAYYDKPSGLLV